MELPYIHTRNSSAATTALRKLAVSLADSTDLRVILSILCIMVEVMRCAREDDTDEIRTRKEQFINELSKHLLC